MTPELWRRVRECFAAVVDMPPDARKAALDRMCGGDVALRREVERLLEQDASEHSLSGGWSTRPKDEGSGERVGAYRLVKEIGRGGMSIVWLAERADEEFRARAAVKFIRADGDTQATSRRFRQERQVLANLRHPNISRLLDAGAMPDGRPYLIMEYVDGVPIDQYCGLHKLSIPERLRLFIEVCAAVHFAHQNLIVHLDLKPANILVGEGGVPTLLDFGIAKLLAPDLTGTETVGGSRPMTPRFASPEQFRGEPLSTASDVYSLGVILYELLTGQAPYRFDSGATWSELERTICETEPVAPSIAVERAAHNGSGGFSASAPALRGDLDTIVLKAMHKTPARRYTSAEQLASDLQRYLGGMPVLARPDTIMYRTTKFVRRNRMAVGLAATVVCLLVALTVVTMIQSVRVAHRQQLADARAMQIQQVASFQASMLLAGNAEYLGQRMMESLRTQMTSGLSSRARLDPDGSVHRRTAEEVAADVAALQAAITPSDATEVGKSVIDEVILAPATRALEGQFADQPEVEARLRYTLGSVYNAYDLRDRAEPHLLRALELQRKTLASGHPDIALTLLELTGTARIRRDFPRAEMLAKEALEIRRNSEHGDTLALAIATNQYALALMDSGKLDASEQVFQESIAMLRRIPEEHADALAQSLGNLGGLMLVRRDAKAAEPLIREALEIERARKADVRMARLLNNLAGVQQALQDVPGAISSLQEAQRIQTRALGEMHDATLTTMGNLAGMLALQKRYSDAEPLASFVLTGRMRTLPPEHFKVTVARVVLADILISTQRKPEAEPLLRDVWNAARQDTGFTAEKRRGFVNRLIDIEQALGHEDLVRRFTDERDKFLPSK